MVKQQFYRTLWGIEDGDLENILNGLDARGIVGLEICLLFTSTRTRELLKAQKDRFKMIFLVQTSGKNVAEHLESIEVQLKDILADFEGPCEKINIHGGLDRWDKEEVEEYFKGFQKLEEKYSDLELLHETHRGRILYSPWSSLRVLKAFPTLKLVADLSHWVVVAERHLDEFPEVMDILYRQTRHIHARPSSPQHIQLGHLDDPLYKDDLDAFNGYWRNIIAAQKERGATVISIDPEIGPFPYSPVQPHTNGKLTNNLEELVDGIITIFASL